MNLVKTIARHLLVSMGVGLLFNGAMAQDTTVVQTFTFDSTGRSEFFVFPDDPNKKYEKILMQYRMRCKNALVSDANDRNKGCGEWDYSCNTYLWDSTNIDSLKYLADDYRISNFSGSTFNYSSTPVYDYYLTWQQNVTVNSIVSETQSTVGTGNAADVDALSTLYYTGKSQYLITAAELTAAGVVAGTIDGLMLNVTGTGGPTDFLSVRMKASSKTNLYATDPEFSNFVEVYHSNTTLTNGSNRLQFHTLYNWDGTSNIIVELAFKNPGFSTAITLEGSNINGFGIASAGDQSFYFNGNNYVEALTYKGIGGTDERTVEAWIKTTTPDKEIVSWGRNSAGQKFVFRLDGSGRVRVEVNGGSIIGTTVLTDGEWHHVACTFNGSDVTDFKLYADGNLEAVSGSTPEPVNTNTTNGINVRISRGVNNRYWVGEIDDVRIWNKALSASVISDYMHQIVDPNHPDFQNLEAYYRFNTPTGETVSDATANAYQAKVVSGSNWHKMNALEIHKGFKNTQTRPNFTFLQGNYNLTVVGDSIFDSIAQFTNFVEELQVVSHPGVLQDDELQVLNSNHYWGEGYAYYFDESGVKYDSVAIQTDGSVSITIDALEYFRRFASKFELMSFVTPYGIGLDLGVDGKMWEFDMTDFTPVLKGGKRISLERGGQNQEEMDIRFLFIEGTPERDVIDIKQVWKVDARSYTDILSNKYFAPVDYPLDPTATTYKLRTAITGHGQEGEFIPRSHFIDLNGAGNEFTWDVWMECGENPVYPQGGTWIYDRAGWCPGMATDLRENEITNYVTPGTTVNIDYGLSTASGDSRYIVNHQLVSYGDANFSTNASVVDIISPSTKVEHARFNENCTSLRIKIRNSGSEDIKNMKINYWINGSTTPFVHSWIGNMAYLQEQEVSLPIPAGFWNGVSPSDKYVPCRSC